MKRKTAYFSLILIIAVCFCACVNIDYEAVEQGTANTDANYVNENELDQNKNYVNQNQNTSSDSAEKDNSNENYVNQSETDSNENYVNQKTEGSSDDEDWYYSETGAAIVPYGSLYPEGFDAELLPEYEGKKYVLINDGKPFFKEEDYKDEAFELYSSLDSQGRCGTAYANICPEIMPTEKRGDISEIHPTGWKQQRYDGIVDADPPYLYNRSHLIAYKLAGENANIYNLITGTRYFNAVGMTYVEDRVYDYVKDTGNHVLYRVTPVFKDDELVARGVLMEAGSVEDDKICFCEFVYNVQPGIYIDYATGENHKE